MNMSYCRFQNTLLALRDCYNSMEKKNLSIEEFKSRKDLIYLCMDIIDDYKDMVEEDFEDNDWEDYTEQD
jgi:hypothetical protein